MQCSIFEKTQLTSTLQPDRSENTPTHLLPVDFIWPLTKRS